MARMAAGAIEDGPYRLRSASDAAWAGSAAYGHRETFWEKTAAVLTAVLRMILPVLSLLACFAALYLYRDTPMPLFLDGTGTPWLTASHLLVPLAFLCVHLTNRRYGPAYAFAQVVIVSALVVGLVLFAGDQIAPYLPQSTLPTMREAIGLGAAFFAASFVSIVVFDGARGARWWTAPLFGFLSAAVFFALIFFPTAYAGTGALWLAHSVKYMGLLMGEGVLLLIPYWMLRGIVQPLSGFGGY
ncbi:MAG: VUT family protein [Alphaproteobacteria bacterium]|nr:VUT family protein [Alphaproteobacteria bacterium]